MNKQQLLFKRQVKFENEYIHIPTVGEVLELGESKMNEINSPFLISLDYLDINEEQKKEIKNFDLFFIKIQDNGETIDNLTLLMNSLKFYFNTDDVMLLNNYMAIKVNNLIIHRDNYDELKNIIFEINKIKLQKPEKAPEFKSEKQREVYYKIMQGRKKSEEKLRITLDMVIGAVQFGGKSYISYDEIENMTLMQLYNAYDKILIIHNFESEYSKYLAGCDPKSLDLTPWIYQFKNS